MWSYIREDGKPADPTRREVCPWGAQAGEEGTQVCVWGGSSQRLGAQLQIPLADSTVGRSPLQGQTRSPRSGAAKAAAAALAPEGGAGGGEAEEGRTPPSDTFR